MQRSLGNGVTPLLSRVMLVVGLRLRTNCCCYQLDYCSDPSASTAWVPDNSGRCGDHASDMKRTCCRAEELAKVIVSRDDVKVVAREFALDNKVADTKLRENLGDLKKTLKSLIREGLPTEM
jgi:hypothetical protein